MSMSHKKKLVDLLSTGVLGRKFDHPSARTLNPPLGACCDPAGAGLRFVPEGRRKEGGTH